MARPASARQPERQHRYADATYRVYRLGGGGYGIEVTVPDQMPVTVTNFQSRAAARTWISTHRDMVETQSTTRAMPVFLQRK